jgi:hypothetical protein
MDGVDQAESEGDTTSCSSWGLYGAFDTEDEDDEQSPDREGFIRLNQGFLVTPAATKIQFVKQSEATLEARNSSVTAKNYHWCTSDDQQEQLSPQMLASRRFSKHTRNEPSSTPNVPQLPLDKMATNPGSGGNAPSRSSKGSFPTN